MCFCLLINRDMFQLKFKIDNVYTSSAVNSTPSCADWNGNNVICYGSANAVLINYYDGLEYKNPKITQALKGHSKRVNSVKWILKKDNEFELVSGSNDRTAILWEFKNDKFSLSNILEGHCDAITSVDGSYTADGSTLVVTGSVDSTVKIWKRIPNEVQFHCVQTIDFYNGVCLSLCLYLMPCGEPLLAIARDDCKVCLFTRKEELFVKLIDIVGHEDWVRGLDFTIDDSGKMLLATCSQDTYIRIWSFAPQLDSVHSEIKGSIQIEKKILNVYGDLWAFSLEAVLSGHEGWIYSVRWHPPTHNEFGARMQPMKLLSASLDKTMIIWELEASVSSTNDVFQNSVWIEKVRVGEVGGNGLGFYGGIFGPYGKAIMGHGYAGSFHMWNCSLENNSWDPTVVCGGHYKEVVDIGWEPADGVFLMSISTDQTTRVHARWLKGGKESATWHEVARPQVHGYDMSALAVISKFKFVSGAEEKVIRAFEAPHNFLKSLVNISKLNCGDSGCNIEELATGASVPSLGLSNKAVYNMNENINNQDKLFSPDQCYIPIVLHVPPTEETLMQNTLWPEIKKLYGHGYEIYTLAASKDGLLIASACKATTPQHAAIILWDAKTWVQLQTLTSHQLTVTQLEFSPDNTRLLSVSRDRRFSIFQKNYSDNTFTLVSSSDKKNGIHTRIIWCCSWTHDSKYFTTGSRDGKVVAWTKSDLTTNTSLGEYVSVAVHEIPTESVTAVAFSSLPITEHCYLMAIGFEKGHICLYQFLPDCSEIEKFQLAVTFNSDWSHSLTIRRLKFRPASNTSSSIANFRTVQLASCGNDHAVKIFNVSYKI